MVLPFALTPADEKQITIFWNGNQERKGSAAVDKRAPEAGPDPMVTLGGLCINWSISIWQQGWTI